MAQGGVKMSRRCAGVLAGLGVAVAGLGANGACGHRAGPEPAKEDPKKTPAPATETPKPGSTKPGESKPSETKPAGTKPTETSGSATKPAEVPAGFIKVDLGGKGFTLELALTPARRFRGLSERGVIPQGAGMLFVFPTEQVSVQNFVMRDCPAPIDIVYLDQQGRVLAMHEMKAEEPRGQGEKENTLPYDGAPAWSAVNMKYESRLKGYSSRFPSQFVIEVAGGTLKALPKPLKVGDRIELDIAGLKKQAK